MTAERSTRITNITRAARRFERPQSRQTRTSSSFSRRALYFACHFEARRGKDIGNRLTWKKAIRRERHAERSKGKYDVRCVTIRDFPDPPRATSAAALIILANAPTVFFFLFYHSSAFPLFPVFLSAIPPPPPPRRGDARARYTGSPTANKGLMNSLAPHCNFASVARYLINTESAVRADEGVSARDAIIVIKPIVNSSPVILRLYRLAQAREKRARRTYAPANRYALIRAILFVLLRGHAGNN